MLNRFSILLLTSVPLLGQTTQGLISGRIADSITGQPIIHASIAYTAQATSLSGSAESSGRGVFTLPLLSPGVYRVRATAPGYQAQEIYELELSVAARLELDFRLRPLHDVWESGEYNSVFLPRTKAIVTFFGPDVDTTRSASFEGQGGRRAPLEATVSEVIDSALLDNLPLQGRDVYALLVTQPGVTSDSATARGLGLSINGQRPTASNFLLDGVENNNYLVTGPLTPVAPEAVQEYRVSTNNFSAEYGRTSGYLANAVTRAGGNRLNGAVYAYLKNEALNANGFQQNLMGQPRLPVKELQPGYFLGGPVLRNRLFFSSAFEHFRSRSQQDPFPFVVPTTTFLNSLAEDSSIRQLLTRYPTPVSLSGPGLLSVVSLSAPVSLDRSLALERLDYTAPSGRDRVMARAIVAAVKRPDFAWSPYKDFVTPLVQNTWAAAASHVHTFTPSVTNEFRASYTSDDLHFNRAHPEVPTLNTVEGIALPGSPLFYSYSNRGRNTELLDNIIWAHSRHLFTGGAGFLWRTIDGYLTSGRDTAYFFGRAGASSGLVDLILDQPRSLFAPLDRLALPATVREPRYDREYRYSQFFLFAQDTWKLTPRLTVNYGLRYENFGAPANTGEIKDVLLQPGAGRTVAEQLPGATLRLPSSGAEQLFGTDNLDFALRAGASFDLFGNAGTLIRGAVGSFYDRPFDNLWQNVRNNNLILPLIAIPGHFNYLAPPPSVVSQLPPATYSTNFPDLTLIDPNLRNGRAYSYFAGVQQRITANVTLELNALGTYGRRLITTDVVNRDFSAPAGRLNPDLPDINYRANQGSSDFNAFTAVARYRGAHGMLQASYTWSHYIDIQSDPLVGDFFDLSFTAIASGSGLAQRAAFSRQFDPQSDRGNSDFDQRHNFVFFSYWQLPDFRSASHLRALSHNWTVATLAGFRTGFPYTVTQGSATEPGAGIIFNPRPDLIDPGAAVLSSPVPVPGGQQLLNAAAFRTVSNRLGNEGRNAFRGPGLYNIDLSLARSFNLPGLPERARLTLRADAFNLLNHANLNNPDSALGDGAAFGIASFGRLGRQSGFPAIAPLNETARQIQLLLKLEF